VNPIVLIPARMASTRLPGKPLADICGKPMIARVVERALEARLGPVAVAAAEEEIARAAESAGARAVLTDPNHPSGSDRIFEALQKLDPAARHDVVVNLQGDLPAIDPAAIRACLLPLDELGCDIGTLAAEIVDPSERTNPNVTKAVVAWDKAGDVGHALYFTRASAPYGDGPLFHHIGIYAYRREALATFVRLPPSTLEKREKLEQLRALESGMTIGVARVPETPLAVDTEADIARAREFISRATV